jgi:ankyrin repeat protein
VLISDTQNEEGRTALHLALLAENVGNWETKPLVSFLVNEGPSSSIVSPSLGATAVDLAAMKRDLDILQLLLSSSRLKKLRGGTIEFAPRTSLRV